MYTYQPFDDTQQKYNFVATGGYLFETEERATLFCQMWNAHWDALRTIEAVPGTLPRADYEASCKDAGVEALADAECDSYGVRYGEFTPWFSGEVVAGYSPAHAVKMALARRRLNGIEQERKVLNRAKPARQPVPETLCDCGHYTAHPMNASMGSSCPDCYDRMSE